MEDYENGMDIEKGFKKLESEKCYGGLDYAIFFEGAKKDLTKIIEQEWEECLNSARAGGSRPISVMAAKTLISMGGMMRLRDATNDDLPWMKKEFTQTYPIYENYAEQDVRCFGLEAVPYLPKIETLKELEGKAQ